MKKVRFEDKLKNKIAENNKKREELENNKDKYRVELKNKIIKDIEERILRSVPNYVDEEELTLSGPIFFINKDCSKLYIDYNYEEPKIFFNDIHEIEEFLKEIVAEFESGLIYEVNIYTSAVTASEGSITFKYEYKES